MYQRMGIRMEFSGGPFDGQPHNGCYRQIFTSETGESRWVAYIVGADGRAEFIGWATTQANARKVARVWEKRMRNEAQD